jgi:hypothetical protein
MDIQAAQLGQQIKQTRPTMATELDPLQQHGERPVDQKQL